MELTSLAKSVLIFLALAAIGRAQVTTADVLGTVTDPSGGLLPNATIVLTNKGTGETRTTQPN